ncbi:hypothetical protein L1049_014447 [Liquidambar formosana]|uniref:Uncharacterized protein n=1 Tax=Liquidambar formosana TaxID=63359 RepID=A0AAP0RVT0_LIQFO
MGHDGMTYPKPATKGYHCHFQSGKVSCLDIAIAKSQGGGGGGGGRKEYVYSAEGWLRESTAEPLPRPRMDGLHIYTYRAFIDAVKFYLEMSDISDLFHIRGMSLHRIHDRSKKWRRMEEDDSVFVYGTLDQATYNSITSTRILSLERCTTQSSSINRATTLPSAVVPLKATIK